MTYVMVPVPEEIAPQVQSYLNHNIARRVFLRGPEDVVAVTYAEGDDETRSLLFAVANAIVDGEELTFDTTCRNLGLSHREMMGLVAEINFNVNDAGGATATLYAKPELTPPPPSVPKWAHRDRPLRDPA